MTDFSRILWLLFFIYCSSLVALGLPKTIFEFEIAYNKKCEEGYPFYRWIVSDNLPLQKIDGGYLLMVEEKKQD